MFLLPTLLNSGINSKATTYFPMLNPNILFGLTNTPCIGTEGDGPDGELATYK